MTENPSIVTAGGRTALGLRAAPSAAALRAGISGVAEHPFMIDRAGDPMSVALDPELDVELMGPSRLVALADSALREACAPLQSGPRSTSQVPLYLGLPEPRPGFSRQDAEAVRRGVAEIEGLPVEFSEVEILTEGHAAGLAAFRNAAERIERGEAEACIVAGVDSYVHPDTVDWLEDNRQLAGALARSAFVPGEGAGACLLMTAHLARRLQLRSAAYVTSVATASETKLIKTPNICLGNGLTAAVGQATRRLQVPDEKIHQIICDVNGERYRGEEWGFVCLRLSRYFEDPSSYLSPADCWGDVGAASGPLFAMLACEAAVRGYASGSRTLLWASSEGGLRAAAVLVTTTAD